MWLVRAPVTGPGSQYWVSGGGRDAKPGITVLTCKVEVALTVCSGTGKEIKMIFRAPRTPTGIASLITTALPGTGYPQFLSVDKKEPEVPTKGQWLRILSWVIVKHRSHCKG